ncbi:uncharacterized protein ARMOST_18153 [Armillaria ostoyae]|uniref:Uncharacterized protein n=1 Tax=Armillaria ostoyae TaxID=47428 RepID=A0A284S131_ARMOS|nr:uncharacterized protein ARMOST_18153 [Armillaria ostoyae]
MLTTLSDVLRNTKCLCDLRVSNFPHDDSSTAGSILTLIFRSPTLTPRAQPRPEVSSLLPWNVSELDKAPMYSPEIPKWEIPAHLRFTLNARLGLGRTFEP